MELAETWMPLARVATDDLARPDSCQPATPLKRAWLPLLLSASDLAAIRGHVIVSCSGHSHEYAFEECPERLRWHNGYKLFFAPYMQFPKVVILISVFLR